MKKLTALMMTLCLCAFTVGCGEKDTATTTTDTPAAGTTDADTGADGTTDSPADPNTTPEGEEPVVIPDGDDTPETP